MRSLGPTVLDTCEVERRPWTRSTIEEGRGCNKFVPVLRGDGKKIAPTGDIFDQTPGGMSWIRGKLADHVGDHVVLSPEEAVLVTFPGTKSSYPRPLQSLNLAGNTLLRHDYRMAARSGFTASAAPAPPPKASFRSSPPPRSARLGSTIPLGLLTSPHPTLGSNSQMDNSPPAAPPVVQYLAPGNDNRAAAEQLSNNLLSYSHHDWDQAQRADPLCDATRR